ncbi:MAG: lysophospholipid acyltransferase family protein [Clostridiales bacterium]
MKFSGFQIIGRENIPDDKAIVIAGNHTSYFDAPMMSCAFPYHITYLAKEEFAHNIITQKLFSALGAVFLKRNEADIMALKKALRVLKDNKAIGIFAEGKRNLDSNMSDFKQGTAFIAYKAGVKILPVAILNPKHFFMFWKRDKKIVIGKPIDIVVPSMEQDDRKKLTMPEILTQITVDLQNNIGDLLDEYSIHKN